MANEAPPISATTAAIISLLETTGIDVGDAISPTPDRDPPYMVVWNVSPGQPEGPFDDYQSDQMLRYQVMCIGITREQMDWVRDKVRGVFTQDGLTVPGRRVMFVQLDVSGFGTTVRDEDFFRPYFVGVDQYQVATTPA